MAIDDTERARRRALFRAHFAVENHHQLDGIMATFAPDAVMLYNRDRFADAAAIRGAHAYMGFSTSAGALEGLETIVDAEHFTDDEVVIEGRVCAKHVGEFQGFAPTGRMVELPYVAFYRFDGDGKLTSERVIMNLGVLLDRR